MHAILWIHKKITDGNISTFDRIMWILLLVIFVICFISSFFGIGGSGLALAVNIIVAICDIVIYLFMIAFMLDNSVKAKFGM